MVDPADYGVVLAEVRSDGGLSASTRKHLAAKAFAAIAGYDAAIARWFLESADPEGTAPQSGPTTRSVT